MLKKLLKIFTLLLLLSVAIFFLYFNNINRVDTIVKNYYLELKDSLLQKGYKPKLVVISTKRVKWHNDLLTRDGAAKDSRHLTGDAIDFIVLDINSDGEANGKDVDIVFELLDKEIITDKGGIGTYKNEKRFFNKQMIHIDCRGVKARWAR